MRNGWRQKNRADLNVKCCQRGGCVIRIGGGVAWGENKSCATVQGGDDLVAGGGVAGATRWVVGMVGNGWRQKNQADLNEQCCQRSACVVRFGGGGACGD